MKSIDYSPEIRLAESTVNSIHDLFTRRETIDAQLHERMLEFLRPIISAYPEASWLTIGDEGIDGWLLRQYGAKTVTASSISDARLRKAADLGHLKGIEVRALNAEHLDLPDNSVDFILCRQAYHHVRRAPLAFYEFMRVARRGFVLIEPMECSAPKPLDAVRMLSKMLLRRRRPEYSLFEPAGNFVYRISERDIFRMLAAVQFPWFAIKTFNSFYLPWIATRHRGSLLAQAILRLGVSTQDCLSSCRLISPGLCVAFVPTQSDAEGTRRVLHSARFRIVTIPRNPYPVAL